MTEPNSQAATARWIVVDGALKRGSSLALAIVGRGSQTAFATSLVTALDERRHGVTNVVIVAFEADGACCGEQRGSPQDQLALRGRDFVATVDAGDAKATAAAFDAGALGVVERDCADEVVLAHLENALRFAVARRERDRWRTHVGLVDSNRHTGFWELVPEAGQVWCSAFGASLLSIEGGSQTMTVERWLDAVPTESRRGLATWIGALTKGLPTSPFDHVVLGSDGLPLQLVHTGYSELDENGHCTRATVMVEPARATRAVGSTVHALHGGARVLLDSVQFLELVDRAIQNAGRTQRHVAVLFIDVHRIRSLTSGNLSNDAGAHLLDTIAGRVREGVRSVDSVANLGRVGGEAVIACIGGDQLCVLLADLPRLADAAKVAARVLELLSQPFQIADCELCVPASIGIAGFPTDHHAPDELLRRAETAAYCARNDGHASMKFYSSALDTKAFERLTLETSLRRALERNEFVVYYQPRVEIRTQRILGFEALIRWKHPDLGFVSPAQFIPLAEETGLIVPIGEWVLREACRQNRAWQDAGLTPVRMAVNLSSVQFNQPGLQETVRTALEDSKLAADWLELELTESTVMNDAGSAVATLARLKSSGVHLSIDDFGTGYSSLAYLKRFPIDALKIDQSFIREVTSNPDDAAIVTSIILMARSLKLGVVAEGVETQSQLSFLRVLQCDEAQGYLFSPPVPAALAGQLLAGGLQRRGAA